MRRRRFKELLNENTIREVASFQSQLRREAEEIRERIAIINQSLHEIDYARGRYIRQEEQSTSFSGALARIHKVAARDGLAKTIPLISVDHGVSAVNSDALRPLRASLANKFAEMSLASRNRHRPGQSEWRFVMRDGGSVMAPPQKSGYVAQV